jgi:hypothetical protein
VVGREGEGRELVDVGLTELILKEQRACFA